MHHQEVSLKLIAKEHSQTITTRTIESTKVSRLHYQKHLTDIRVCFINRERSHAQSQPRPEASPREWRPSWCLLSRRAPPTVLLWGILAESLHGRVSLIIVLLTLRLFLSGKTSSRKGSLCWRSMLRSSKTWTCRSSYTCRWSKTTILESQSPMTWATSMDRDACLTQVVASQLSEAVPPKMAPMTLACLQTNT